MRSKPNTNVCPPGSVAVETVPECKRAAESLVLSYTGQANTPQTPKGCYVYGNTDPDVFFNFDAIGSAREGATPICRDMSTPSPTRDGQTMVPTIAPSAPQASKYVLVADPCRVQEVYYKLENPGDLERMTSRVKLVPDEAACAAACGALDCEGYPYCCRAPSLINCLSVVCCCTICSAVCDTQ